MADLVERIRRHVLVPSKIAPGRDSLPTTVFPPASAVAVAEAELTLRVRLPETLVRLYTELGNGGFGPGEGLLGLRGGATDDLRMNLLDRHAELCSMRLADPSWRWPPKRIPIAYLGESSYACLDAPHGEIVWFLPTARAREGRDVFLPLAEDLDAWLEAWLAGEDTLGAAWARRHGEAAWR